LSADADKGDQDAVVLAVSDPVAHTLSTQCGGATEDGTGRGSPLVAQHDLLVFDEQQITLKTNQSRVQGVVAINFQGGKGNSAVSTDGSCPTLAAMHGSDVHVVAVPSIVNIEHGLHATNNPNSVQLRDVSDALTRSEHKGHSLVLTAGAPVTAARESGKGYWMEDNVAGTVGAQMGTSGSGRSRAAILAVEVPRVASDDTIAFKAGIASSLVVRRLTPRECERLQGFPDNWTLVPYKGKLAGDSGRYKTLGNSMSVNVMRFIGERIHRHVEASTKK
jgi:DNA (cytosine-5)-methyltransferase 1